MRRAPLIRPSRLLAIAASVLLSAGCVRSRVGASGDPTPAPASPRTAVPVGAYVVYECTESARCETPRRVRSLRTLVARSEAIEVIETFDLLENGGNRVEQRHYSTKDGSLLELYEGVAGGVGTAMRPAEFPGGEPNSPWGTPRVLDVSERASITTRAGTFQTVHQRTGASLLFASISSDVWRAVDGSSPFPLVRGQWQTPWGCTSREELVEVHWDGGVARLRTGALDRVLTDSKRR